MRTTSEIQAELQAEWMNNATLQQLYHFEPGTQFTSFYSKASIESIILYIVAFCAHVVEAMLATAQDEMEDRMARQLPGTCRWYAQKLKDYLYDFPLDGWGEPITDGHADGEIAAAQIIKHAVAIDDQTSGYLLLKIAGESEGARCPLTDYETEIQNYILRIKYAGVKTRLIDAEGDTFDASIDIWHDPLRNRTEVHNRCESAVREYLQNLPFNGEMSIMALTDALQSVDGVEIVQVKFCSSTDTHGTTTVIEDKSTPYAGYYTPGTITLNLEAYT
jgi:hypothetical protein